MKTVCWVFQNVLVEVIKRYATGWSYVSAMHKWKQRWTYCRLIIVQQGYAILPLYICEEGNNSKGSFWQVHCVDSFHLHDRQKCRFLTDKYALWDLGSIFVHQENCFHQQWATTHHQCHSYYCTSMYVCMYVYFEIYVCKQLA